MTVESYEITLHRTEYLLGGGGIMLGFSDDFPSRQFLIVPDDHEVPQ